MWESIGGMVMGIHGRYPRLLVRHAAVLTIAALLAGMLYGLLWPERAYAVTLSQACEGGKRMGMGDLHSLALKSDGTVVAWGDNRHGQCNVPADIQGSVVAVAAGSSHSVALKSDGTVAAWGDNGFFGQCNVPAGLTDVVAVAVADLCSLALKSDGTVAVWGPNNWSQCNVPEGLTGVVTVTAGSYHYLAVKSDGTVAAWGLNNDGQCNVPAGIQGSVVAVAAGYDYSLALLSNGTVVAWGYNSMGQCDVPGGLTGVVAVAAGRYHCLALLSNGTVAAWGGNQYGQCDIPAEIQGHVVAVEVRSGRSLALLSDGTVAAWGYDGYGLCDIPDSLNLAGRLSGLTLSDGALSPGFSPDIQDYIVSVANSVYSLEITPSAASPGLDIAVQGIPTASGTAVEVPLAVGSQTVTTSVYWDRCGLTRDYNIIVSRAEPLYAAASDPADGSINIPVNTLIKVDFNKNAYIGANFNDISITGGGTVVSYTYSLSDSRLVLNPAADLDHSVTYEVYLPTGSLEDGDGIPMPAGHSFSFTTAGPAHIIGSAVPAAGTTGAEYSHTFTASGGSPPYSFSLAGGSLPGGLSLSAGGILSGIPTSAGTFNYTISVSDSVYESDSHAFTQLINLANSGSGGRGGGASAASQPVSSTTGSATVSPAAGGTVGLGSEMSLKIPANALKGNDSLPVAVERVDTPPSAPAGFMILGAAYKLTVDGQDHYSFNKPVTLTFTFDPSSLAPGETPAVYYYDENSGQWVNIGGTVSGNTITVTVDHFTQFAVLAAEKAAEAQMQKPSAPLTDISGHWAESNISKLIEMGAISGYPDSSFRPDSTITRAEFATVLVKAFKLEPKEGRVFADTAGHWARDYISTAAACGIVGGYDENTFGPDDPVTREQMAVMAVKAAKLSPASEQLTFKDSADISAWAREAVATVVKGGIMKGNPDNTFSPGSAATRAEAVTVIVSALNN